MLDANLKTQLKGYLERLTLPVELVASLDGSAKSAELKELLEEIATLSDKVTFAEADEDMRKPSFAIVRADTDVSVRFAGIPMGRIGTPEDVANCVVFLLGQEGAYITGKVLQVDGGQMI